MLRLYDTLSRRKKPFRPVAGNLVRVYTCGPSVYNYSHIGNFRTYLFEDVLVRYLRYRGFRVKRVMNITDVEDKAVAAARRDGIALDTLEKDKIRAFFSDYDKLGMRRPDIVAKASEHVPQMLGLLERLCARGFCVDGKDGVYFDVRRFRRYGRLSRLRSRRYLGRASGDDYAKEGLWDFRLWKRWSRGDGPVCWDSPFGKGRPGWHIECSAMAMHYLGESIDIHCGGSDNIFPHHENEIAQSEGGSGKRFANFWLHSRHLTIGKRKMSKRTGNVLYVKDVLRMGVHPECLRFYLISERYRMPLDFTLREFERKVCGCERTGKAVRALSRMKGRGKASGKGGAIAKRLIEGFEGAMDDDLNTGLAFRRIFLAFHSIEEMMRAGELTEADAKEILAAMRRINSVLGVF